MLLPAAQSAAIWHGYSHVAQDLGGRQADQSPSDASHCGLCLAAAAVTGGALLLAQPGPPGCVARFEAPRCAAGRLWVAAEAPAYRSRAPPETRRAHC